MHENYIHSFVSVDKVKLAHTTRGVVMEPAKTAIHKAQLILDMKTKLPNMTFAK